MARADSKLHSFGFGVVRTLGRAPVFSVLSFVLLIFVIGLWVESSKVSGVFGVRDWAGRLQAVGSDRGGVVVFLSDLPFGRDYRWTADVVRVPMPEFLELHGWLYGKLYLRWHAIGFWFARGGLKVAGSLKCRFGALTVPYWMLIGVLSVLPVRMIWRGCVRWRRGRRGECRECGYDLRQSPGRCPECGAEKLGRLSPISPSVGFGSGRLIAWVAIVLWVAGVSAVLVRGRRVEGTADARVAEPVPERQIGLVRVDQAPLKDAVAALSAATGVPIEVPSGPVDNTVSAEFRNISLGSALESLLTVFPDSRSVYTKAGRVVIERDGERSGRFEVYPIDDLLRLVPEPEPLENPDGTRQFGYVPPSDLKGNQFAGVICALAGVDSDNWLYASGRIIMVESEHGHQMVRFTLRLLRSSFKASPAGDHYSRELKVAYQGEVSFGSTALGDVFKWVSSATGASVVVDSKALEDRGIKSTSPVHLHLVDPTMSQMASAIVKSSGAEAFDFDEERNVLFFSSIEKLQKHGAVVRIYDVRDVSEQAAKYVIAARSRFPAIAWRQPPPKPKNVLYIPPALKPPVSMPEVVRSEMEDSLVLFIEHAIDSDNWSDNGGVPGVIYPFKGRILIKTSPENHAAIERLLEQVGESLRGNGLRVRSTLSSSAHEK